MKKLFTLSIVLMLACNVFGQTQGAFNRIKKESDHLDMFPNELTNTYSFEADGKFYMLSYDTCSACVGKTMWKNNEIIKRGVWLFCQDTNGRWSKATTEPIQVDYMKTVNGVFSHNLYFPMEHKPEHGQFVGKRSDGDIQITIACQTIGDYDFERSGKPRSDFYRRIVLLTPTGDGTYAVAQSIIMY
jgi:hypothetical protein